jgi:glycine cleavage system H protein
MNDTVKENLKYAKSHEWVLDNGDGTVTIGITDRAQDLLGDIVFVELPELGSACTSGSEFSVIESVKAASDIYAPVTGEVIEVNAALEDAPEQINTDAYGTGWLCKIKLDDAASQLGKLLDAAAYTLIASADS